MSIGPVMLGLEGLSLSDEERELLRHPLVGGVILFTRNYESPAQLTELTAAARAVKQPLLIAVDQEGGRVRRFRDGFSALPAQRRWGDLYDQDAALALQLARAHGRLLALEIAAVGIDFTFAPVLDLDRAETGAIGDRALHSDPAVVIALAREVRAGLRDIGMAAVGKHFPGHGSVGADSHVELPVDPRPLAELEQTDLRPFAALAEDGIEALMPALVVYPEVDDHPACFSRRWLQDILRGKLGFRGALFSDDLGMAGAAFAGGPLGRAKAALAAGCDMVLACNERAAAVAMLDGLTSAQEWSTDASAGQRLLAMRGAEFLPEAPSNAARSRAARSALRDDARARLQSYLSA